MYDVFMKKTECIIWPGCKDKDGYGLVKIAGISLRAHRVALEKKLGRKLISGECALHSCHNPSCVNPLHLDPGTKAQNNKQSWARRPTLAKTILGIK